MRPFCQFTHSRRGCAGVGSGVAAMNAPEPTSLPPTPWSRAFHVLVKPFGSRCNLDCTYCYYREKAASLYPHTAVPRMTDETLEAFVRSYLASQPGEEVVFAWQGGEPTLMGIDFFRRAVRLQQVYAAGRRVTNTIQTNGTLLDDAWGRFFAENQFLVGISLDGPRELHDAYRVDRGGHPSWHNVMQGLRVLRQHRVEFNTLTVVHRRNVRHAHKVYDFLQASGSNFMQFIPLIERKAVPAETAHGLSHGAPHLAHEGLVPRVLASVEVAHECAAPKDVGAFLSAIFDHWVRRDVGRVFVQTFDAALSAWMGLPPPVCVWQERCGAALALEHNGDVFVCDHYVYPSHRLGNLHATPLADLGHGMAARSFGEAKADLPRVCRECPVRFACNGDCPKHRFVVAGEGEPGVSYLCPGYRDFFTHIGPTMERMAALVHAGRPAAEIMRRH